MLLKPLVVGLTLTATVALSAGLPVPVFADPGPETLTVLHWNMAGAIDSDDPNKPDNEGRLKPVGALVRAIKTYRPEVISVNEICHSQYTHLVKELKARDISVTANFQPTSSPGTNCSGWAYADWFAGNVILTTAPARDEKDYYFDGDDITDERQDRGAACLTAEFSRRVRVCSFHLSTTDEPPGPRPQAQKFVDTFEDRIRDYPYLLIGDFNLEPDKLRDVMYAPIGQFNEADEDDNSPTYPNHAPSRKLDYVFANVNHFEAEMSAQTRDLGTCYDEHPCSDHRMLLAEVTLAADGGSGGGYPVEPPAADQPPSVDAGPDRTGDEGAAITLGGRASDAESAPSVRWTYYPDRDIDPGATCTFADPNAAATSIRCTDDGTYRVELTASDGTNPPVSDGAIVRVANAPPRLSLTGPAPWRTYRVDTPVELRATFVDPGANDTHTCTVDWDADAPRTDVARRNNCDRVRVFEHAGMYTIRVTVADDDGGMDSASVLVIVYDPEAGFVTAAGRYDSPQGALATEPGSSSNAHFALAAKYLFTDDTSPVGKLGFKLDGTPLRLHARRLEWLVITPDNKVAIKGTGRVGHRDGYGFVAYAHSDRFRIIVWSLDKGTIPTDATLYDNRRLASYDVDDAEPQPISSGVVVIHSGWLPGIPRPI